MSSHQPQHTNPLRSWELLERRGDDLYFQARYRLAASEYKAVYESMTNDPEYSGTEKNAEKAMILCKQARATRLAEEWGRQYGGGTNESVSEEMERILRQAVELYPSHIISHIQIIQMLVGSSQWARAQLQLESLEQNVKQDEMDPDYLLFIASTKDVLSRNLEKPQDIMSISTEQQQGGDSSRQQPTTEPQQPVRYSWFQSDSHVTIDIYAKNVNESSSSIDIKGRSLAVSLALPSKKKFDLEIQLCHSIMPGVSQVRYLPVKVEIRLAKTEAGARWETLERNETALAVPSSSSCISTEASHSMSPVTQSRQQPGTKPKKNWDDIAKELPDDDDDDDDKPNGAMALFQKLYQGSDENAKRAMMKSFMESKGTVLSNNWNDVGKRKVEKYKD